MKRKDMLVRFMGRVSPEPNTGCWIWTGGARRDGYGRFSVDRHPRPAHRVSWLLHNGRWPTPCARHTCDMPWCVNPDHLMEGSQSENMLDMYARRRHHRNAGERNGSAKLTAELASQLRLARSGGATHHELAESFGISKSAVYLVLSGRTWRGGGLEASRG